MTDKKIFGLLSDNLDSYKIQQHIKKIRAHHLSIGGDPKDFPEYLRQRGCTVDGPLLLCSGNFLTAMELST